MLPFIIEKNGRVDRWNILSGRSLSLQNGQLKRRQPTDGEKQGIPNEESSIHFLAKKKSLVEENSCKSIFKVNCCNSKLKYFLSVQGQLTSENLFRTSLKNSQMQCVFDYTI